MISDTTDDDDTNGCNTQARARALSWKRLNSHTVLLILLKQYFNILMITQYDIFLFKDNNMWE